MPPQNAEDWELELTPPACAVRYRVRLEAADLAVAEGRVRGTARRLGQKSFRQTQAPGNTVVIVFVAPKAGAERLVEEVMAAGRILSYDINETMSEEQFSKLKWRADAVKAELEENKRLFAEMPITRGLMGKLLANYTSFIEKLTAVRHLAEIQISITQEKTATGAGQ